MPEHVHRWQVSYELEGTTYRECAASGCRGHQQWICALDRWSDTFEATSPRERKVARTADAKGSASR